MATARRTISAEVPGLAARRVAAEILDGTLRRRRPLDEQLEGAEAHPGLMALSERDRALTRKLVATALRRLGSLRTLLGSALDRGLPDDAPRVEAALLIGAAQILWLDVPDHAAVDLAVRLVQADRRSARYAGLVNAVLRRIAKDGRTMLDELDAPALDTPTWLMARWVKTFGMDVAQAITRMHQEEPPLDLTVKEEAESWAARLRAEVTPTGSVRTVAHGPISMLPGFAEGAWWVQDAAAAMPARLFGDVRARRVADLCAAPGGKTAQLAHAGAHVTAVDRSANRMARMRENLARLELVVETVVADATEWQAGPFDGVLVDAPCSATGTIRRHPDVAWLKREADIAGLAGLQRRLLDRAVALTRPGGTIVYCVCSLEPEEGEAHVAALLARSSDIRRQPIVAAELSNQAEFVTPEGDFRTLPCHLPHREPRMAGLDGFYAARLVRS